MAAGIGKVTSQLEIINDTIDKWGRFADMRSENTETLLKNIAINIKMFVDDMTNVTAAAIQGLSGDMGKLRSVPAPPVRDPAPAVVSAQPGGDNDLFASNAFKELTKTLTTGIGLDADGTQEIVAFLKKQITNQDQLNALVSGSDKAQTKALMSLTDAFNTSDKLDEVRSRLGQGKVSDQTSVLNTIRAELVNIAKSPSNLNGSINNSVSFGGGGFSDGAPSLGLAIAIASIPGFAKRLAKAMKSMNDVFAQAKIPDGTAEEIQARNSVLESVSTVLKTMTDISFAGALKAALLWPIIGKTLANSAVTMSKVLVEGLQQAFEGEDADRINAMRQAPGSLFSALRSLTEIGIMDLFKSAIIFRFSAGMIGGHMAAGITNLVNSIQGSVTDDAIKTATTVMDLLHAFGDLPFIKVIIASAMFNRAAAALENVSIAPALIHLRLQLQPINKSFINKLNYFETFVNTLARLPVVKLIVASVGLGLAGKSLEKIDLKTGLDNFYAGLQPINKRLFTRLDNLDKFIRSFIKLPMIRFAIGLTAFAYSTLALKGVQAALNWIKWPVLNKGIDNLNKTLNKLAKINMKGINKIILASIGIGVAGLTIAGALLLFNKVKPSSFVKAGVAIAGLLGIFKILSKMKINAAMIKGVLLGAIGLAMIGTALIPFAFAVKLMAGVSASTLAGAALFISVATGIALGLGAIAASGYGLAGIALGAAALAIIGIALIPFAVGMKVLSAVKWDSFKPAKMLATFGALALGGMMMAPAAIGFIISSPGLILFGVAMNILGAVKWDSFKPAKMLATFGALSYGGIMMVPAALGFMISSPGLILFGFAMNILSAVEWDNFKPDKMLATFSALSIGALMLLPASIGLLAAGIATIPFGIAMNILSAVEWDNFKPDKMLATFSALALGGIMMVPAAYGLLLVSPGLLAFASGLIVLSKVDFETLNKIKWTTFLKLFSGLALAAPFMVIASAAMILVAPGLFAMSVGLSALSQVNAENISKMGRAIFDLVAGSRWLMFAAAGMAIGGLAMIPLSLGLKAISWAVDPASFEALAEFFKQLTIASRDVSFFGLIKLAAGIAAIALALGPLAIAGKAVKVIKDLAAATVETHGAVVDSTSNAITNMLGIDDKQAEAAKGIDGDTHEERARNTLEEDRKQKVKQMMDDNKPLFGKNMTEEEANAIYEKEYGAKNEERIKKARGRDLEESSFFDEPEALTQTEEPGDRDLAQQEKIKNIRDNMQAQRPLLKIRDDEEPSIRSQKERVNERIIKARAAADKLRKEQGLAPGAPVSGRIEAVDPNAMQGPSILEQSQIEQVQPETGAMLSKASSITSAQTVIINNVTGGSTVNAPSSSQTVNTRSNAPLISGSASGHLGQSIAVG